MIVFDLDGTLADPTHRLNFITEGNSNWDGFFEACDKDAPINEMIDLLDIISITEDVEIWTGRSESVREKTIEWLVRQDLSPDIPLRMRAVGDYRHDTEVKGEFIEKYGRPKVVFEDRNSMVAHWRSLGIRTCQVAEADF